MGVHVSRDDDPEMYKDTYEEAQRIICISDELRVSLEKIEKPKQLTESSKVTSSKLAVKLKLKTPELLEILTSSGCIDEIDGQQVLTQKGETAGGEAKLGRFGAYFIWSDIFSPN